MKLTKETLKQIIKEEIEAVMSEDSSDPSMHDDIKNALMSAYYGGDGSLNYSVGQATMSLRKKYPDIKEEEVRKIAIKMGM